MVVVISFDGIHGAGKSTLIERCAEGLMAIGHGVRVSRANEDEHLGPLRYAMRLSGELEDPTLATLIDLADVAARCQPMACHQADDVVLMDRYLLTLLAKSMVRRSAHVVQEAMNLLSKPNQEILLDVPSRVASERSRPRSSAVWKIGLGVKGTDEFDLAEYDSYQESLRECYLTAAAERGCRVVNGDQAAAAVFADTFPAIRECVEAGRTC
jgi:thymidylate kinase